MSRITQYDSDIGYYVVIDWETECDRNKTTGDDLLTDENLAICKLVEYEDTALTPSQVAEIAEKMKRGELVEAGCPICGMDYVDAEWHNKQLVEIDELPKFKVGDYATFKYGSQDKPTTIDAVRHFFMRNDDGRIGHFCMAGVKDKYGKIHWIQGDRVQLWNDQNGQRKEDDDADGK